MHRLASLFKLHIKTTKLLVLENPYMKKQKFGNQFLLGELFCYFLQTTVDCGLYVTFISAVPEYWLLEGHCLSQGIHAHKLQSCPSRLSLALDPYTAGHGHPHHLTSMANTKFQSL